MRCRICRCTSERGCAYGCAWVEDELCSVCQVVLDVLLLVCAVVGPRWGRLLELTLASLGGTFEDVADEPRVRRALEDLRARRLCDRTGRGPGSNCYTTTLTARRHFRKVLERVERDGLRMHYGEGVDVEAAHQALRAGRAPAAPGPEARP